MNIKKVLTFESIFQQHLVDHRILYPVFNFETELGNI